MNVGKRAHTDALSWDPETSGGDRAPGRRPLTAGLDPPVPAPSTDGRRRRPGQRRRRSTHLQQLGAGAAQRAA